jgi:hypothetical protein
MSSLLLPFTPRFITLTLVTLAALGLAIAVVVGPHSYVVDICLAVALFLTGVGVIDLPQTSLDKGALQAGTVNARWSQPRAMADPHSFRAVA